jgi:hypothetical protein
MVSHGAVDRRGGVTASERRSATGHREPRRWREVEVSDRKIGSRSTILRTVSKPPYRLAANFVDAVLLRLDAGVIRRERAHDELMQVMDLLIDRRFKDAEVLMERAQQSWVAPDQRRSSARRSSAGDNASQAPAE